MLRILRPIRALALALVLTAGAGAALAQGQQGERPPQPVTVVTVQPETVTLSSTLPGRVAASEQAEVRPQVDGIITDRLFEEGGEVAAGDPLYTIDAASYEAAVARAEAEVAQARAEFGAAEKEAERARALVARNVASEQNLDQAASARDAAAAAVQVAEARLRSARIELDRTTIRARVSGEIGLSRTSRGALVSASQTEPLAVIRKIDPVHVDVTQSAAELVRWRRGQAQDDLGAASREVALTLADGSTFAQTGTLTAAEPHVDEQTGVVVLRLEFANPEELLLPGMYVQVEMPTGTAEGVFLTPQEGVSRDRRGRPTALVVNADNVVEERSLTVLRDRGSDWIVGEGLSAGDRVIVAGLQKVAPGQTVAPEERAAGPEETADARASGATMTASAAAD
ncbi:MAG: efflux RND transporter periplasmic adaptor subunit [Azospirillaceae bacterium]